jgi:hypothetical protein
MTDLTKALLDLEDIARVQAQRADAFRNEATDLHDNITLLRQEVELMAPHENVTVSGLCSKCGAGVHFSSDGFVHTAEAAIDDVDPHPIRAVILLPKEAT